MSITLSEIKDPKLRQRLLAALAGATPVRPPPAQTDATAPRQTPKQPLLNKTEQRFRDYLSVKGIHPIFEQAITLRLDQPFKSYRPDLAVFEDGRLVFWEVKAPHRFARAGIAKAACAAKTYPLFTFRLAMRTKEGWKESVLSP
jgi:hypothetical protein